MGSLKRRSLRGVEEPQPEGGMNQPFPDGQSAFPETSSAGASVPQYDFPPSPSGTGVMPEKVTDPRLLATTGEIRRVALATQERATGTMARLPVSTQNTGVALRRPLVIPGKPMAAAGTGAGAKISHRKRRALIYASVITMMVVILFGSLSSVVAAHDGSSSGISRLVSPLVQVFEARNGNAANVPSQAMTPTPTPTLAPTEAPTEEIVAETPSDNTNDPNAGVPVGSITGGGTTDTTTTSSGSSTAVSDYNASRFAYGYCTQWANDRYYALTGYGVPWLGNAYEWSWNAPSYGWTVSDTPNPNGPSIIVLQPDVYQSGSLGHVAVVESPGDYNAATGQVVTSNMNWGQWNVVSTQTFGVGAGVSFVWHP
jgi:surface antigen